MGKRTKRIILSHEDVARMIVYGGDVSTLLGRRSAEELVLEITKSLQHAFDLGFMAAGGSVSAGPVI